MTTVALVHDHFDGPTGMGLVLKQHARWVLEAGWGLWIVGDNVPAELAARARVVHVPRPRRLPALLEHLVWCRRARAALRHVATDLVHVHSPLLASKADLHTAHFISQPSHARGVREGATGVEGFLRAVQAWLTRHLDDRLYRRLRTRTYLSFVSTFLRAEFTEHYGRPRGGWILSPPAPPWRPPAPEERAHARASLGVAPDALAVGYLGGTDTRKGFADVLPVADEAGVHLLLAGPGSERMIAGGERGLGFVDVDPFLAACDVLAAPARFDSAPVAVLQALARGVRVVTTATSGWAEPIERHGCGVVWRGDETLAQACCRAAAAPPERCRAFVAEHAPERQRDALLGAYDAILGARAAPPIAGAEARAA